MALAQNKLGKVVLQQKVFFVSQQDFHWVHVANSVRRKRRINLLLWIMNWEWKMVVNNGPSLFIISTNWLLIVSEPSLNKGIRIRNFESIGKLLLSAIGKAPKTKARQKNRDNFRDIPVLVSSSRRESTRHDFPKKCLMSQLQIN